MSSNTVEKALQWRRDHLLGEFITHLTPVPVSCSTNSNTARDEMTVYCIPWPLRIYLAS